jgi:hypothetical protein
MYSTSMLSVADLLQPIDRSATIGLLTIGSVLELSVLGDHAVARTL